MVVASCATQRSSDVCAVAKTSDQACKLVAQVVVASCATQRSSDVCAVQRGVVFYFPSYHIQKCRSSQKIGRKEIISRFFFFPRDLG